MYKLAISVLIDFLLARTVFIAIDHEGSFAIAQLATLYGRVSRENAHCTAIESASSWCAVCFIVFVL